jgi:soluble lytic murein transglycosylase-like protein
MLKPHSAAKPCTGNTETGMRAVLLALMMVACMLPAAAAAERYDALIARHAAANGVPEALVRRVILRESRYDAGAVGRGGAMGLMQIKHATARGMGYAGSARGLLDADTNLTYAVRYLAGAYRAARGDHGRAMSFYQRGYYYEAKRQRLGQN